MNLATVGGLVSSTVIFIVAVKMTLPLSILVDAHAALLVIGGTIAVTLVCFPMELVLNLIKVFLRRIFGSNKADYLGLIAEIVELSKEYRRGVMAFEAATNKIKNPFLKEGASLLFWAESEISPEEFRELLEIRVSTVFKVYLDEAKVFKTLAKFPPALGLMGTSIGMITLLQSLGGADAKNSIGPAMAIALVATLYGLFFSNFVFIPIGENLTAQAREDLVARKIVTEGLMLINSRKSPNYVDEKLKSFLMPKYRNKAAAAAAAAAAANK
ncbi:MAG: MotA/TolQ/ExbB proton channel family protein [Proteobacteria bacterium]|nr:MotA/TolQ/ExbB proton channel family protein [Pseudomonadota bacterium]